MPRAPETIKQRRDFLACAKARRAAMPGLIVQGRQRTPADQGDLRVGYTCSKKVGNAVARNRAKRRLRAAAAEVLPRLGHAGWDYVLIGRSGVTAMRGFLDLCGDLQKALALIHKDGKS